MHWGYVFGNYPLLDGSWSMENKCHELKGIVRRAVPLWIVRSLQSLPPLMHCPHCGQNYMSKSLHFTSLFRHPPPSLSDHRDKPKHQGPSQSGCHLSFSSHLLLLLQCIRAPRHIRLSNPQGVPLRTVLSLPTTPVLVHAVLTLLWDPTRVLHPL